MTGMQTQGTAMSPARETWTNAKTRLHDLDHAVVEAEAAVEKAPTDPEARGKLEMAILVRDAGRTALAEAEQKLAESPAEPSGDA